MTFRTSLFSTVLTTVASAFVSCFVHAAQVDVLIIYDDQTRDHYNGSPNTAIYSMIDQANTYLANSQVDIQLNLADSVHMELADDLGQLLNNSAVNALRDETGADFVSYITGSYSEGCGVGYRTTRADYAYNMVKRNCMSRSFLHEMGHNMGLGHSLAQESTGSAYSWGIGYGVNSVFSTVMAYESAYNTRQRTYLLSNPNYKCSGYDCGVSNVADSARALNNLKNTYANHRQAPTTTASYVSMRKQNSSGFAIDGNHGGANGQDVYLWSFNSNNANQHWEEISRGGDYYSYKKRGTNFCLDGGGGGADAQNVYLWTCVNNNQNQHWRKVDLGGKYRLEKRNAPAYSIDGNRGGDNGQSIYLWRSNNNNPNQQWIFSNH